MQLTFEGFEKSGDNSWTMNGRRRLLTVDEAALELTQITGEPVDGQRVRYLARMGRLAGLQIGDSIRIWLNC